MISSYGDWGWPPGNNPSYYYRASPIAAQLLWMFSRDTHVLYMQLNIRQIIEMVLLSIFFTRIRSTEGSSADGSYSFCRSMRFALHLAVKILLQIFLKILSIVSFTYICRLHFLPAGMSAWPHFVTQPILLSENIPNIWQLSTKHKEVRPDWKR